MDALIFDFDGVIVDSEPIHYMGFAQVLAKQGIELARQDYYDKYLGFDDHDCFEAVYANRGERASEALIAELTAAKTMVVQHAFATSIQALPGATALIRGGELATIPMAICSGALREEIELAATAIGVRGYFMTIVSAQDVQHGKPSPEGYLRALAELERLTGRVLLAAKTVVVEDSPAGIAAGKAAGMKVLAVATSYEAATLTAADRVVRSLAEVTVGDLEMLVDGDVSGPDVSDL